MCGRRRRGRLRLPRRGRDRVGSLLAPRGARVGAAACGRERDERSRCRSSPCSCRVASPGTTEPGHRVGVYGDAGGLRRLERLSAGRPGLAEPHAGGEVAGSLALRVLGSRESSGDARFADRAGRGGRREHAPKHWVGSEPGLRLRAREHPHASRGVAEVPPHGPLDEGRCRQLEFYLGPIDQPWPDVRCSPWRGSPGPCPCPGLGLVLPAKLGPERDGVRSWRPVRSALSGCLEPQDGSWSHVPACPGTVSAA